MDYYNFLLWEEQLVEFKTVNTYDPNNGLQILTLDELEREFSEIKLIKLEDLEKLPRGVSFDGIFAGTLFSESIDKKTGNRSIYQCHLFVQGSDKYLLPGGVHLNYLLGKVPKRGLRLAISYEGEEKLDGGKRKRLFKVDGIRHTLTEEEKNSLDFLFHYQKSKSEDQIRMAQILRDNGVNVYSPTFLEVQGGGTKLQIMEDSVKIPSLNEVDKIYKLINVDVPF